MWHFDMLVTLKVFKLIGPSNDGRRHLLVWFLTSGTQNLTTFWQLFWQLFDNFLTTFDNFFDSFLTTFWQLLTTFWQLCDNFWKLFDTFLSIFWQILTIFDNFLTFFWQIFDKFLTTFLTNFWQIFDNFLKTFWQLFWHLFDKFGNFLTTFWHLIDIFWQLLDNFLKTFWQLLTIFWLFFILIVLASCGNKYFGTNFIYTLPTSLLIAPGLWTIQFLLSVPFGPAPAKVGTKPLLWISSPFSETMFSSSIPPQSAARPLGGQEIRKKREVQWKKVIKKLW
jgi:hypothetical protein